MSQLRPTPQRQKFMPVSHSVQKPLPAKRAAGDKKQSKRAADLAWQMNFAKMKLNHWHDLDNLDWESLEILLKSAEAGVQDLKAS